MAEAIWGWDYTNKIWRQISVNDEGEPIIDLGVDSEIIDATFAPTLQGLVVASALYNFDGSNWRRILSFQSNADAQVTTAYSQRVQAYLYGFNGTKFDRLLVDASKYLKINIAAVDATLSAADSFGGNVYSKTMTMSDNDPTRFETAAKKLRDVVIIVKTHPMLLGETGVEDYPVGVGETVGFTKVDISTLYFKNAGANNNGVISILGVEE